MRPWNRAEQQPARQAAYDRAAAAAAQLAAAQARQVALSRDLQHAKDELERLQGLIKSSKATKQVSLELLLDMHACTACMRCDGAMRLI